MDNPDILQIIIKHSSLCDNLRYSSINKMFNEITERIAFYQFNVMYYFKRLKIRTSRPVPVPIKRRHNYYTFKNKYINREEEPILFF